MIHPKLDNDEKMVLALQDHWVTMVMPTFLFVIGLALATVVALAAFTLFPNDMTTRGVLLLISFGIGMLFTHWMFIYAFEHEISAWIITTKRVISFNFLPYVKHDVSFIIIKELHEIEKRKRGLVKNILNYGDVEVNLAATPTPVVFNYVPRTSAFCNLLETLHKKSDAEIDIEELKEHYFR